MSAILKMNRRSSLSEDWNKLYDVCMWVNILGGLGRLELPNPSNIAKHPIALGNINQLICCFSKHFIHPSIDAFPCFSSSKKNFAMALRCRSKGKLP
jgi:hypothetical protein